ncbi:hypothetical protein H6P81_018042 [Aristolochia fimbriata]|uniref:Uncharacterized protein n=1 Tax=Aristolochia fimbriata TaxID=158543 RepID=A0AAV7E466_ARIFI|nr:hypothetical protein H6P81_018042 [Aristolochia fimbriata]
MVEGKCSKKYPRSFNSGTTFDKNRYALYKRCDDGKVVNVKGVALDNRWVVPYNANLVKKYDAHINVEVCAHSKAIKYLYKYVHKGSDRATICITQEIVDGDVNINNREISQSFDENVVYKEVLDEVEAKAAFMEKESHITFDRIHRFKKMVFVISKGFEIQYVIGVIVHVNPITHTPGIHENILPRREIFIKDVKVNRRLCASAIAATVKQEEKKELRISISGCMINIHQNEIYFMKCLHCYKDMTYEMCVLFCANCNIINPVDECRYHNRIDTEADGIDKDEDGVDNFTNYRKRSPPTENNEEFIFIKTVVDEAHDKSFVSPEDDEEIIENTSDKENKNS